MFGLSIYFERNFVKEYKMSKKASKIVEEFSKFKGLEKSIIRKMCIGTELNKVGYIGLPKQIIEKLKNDQELTQGEIVEYREYPKKGIEILASKYREEYDNPTILGIIREHAERLDGKGFPSRISGKAILKTTYIANLCIWFIEENSKGKTILKIVNELEEDRGFVPKKLKKEFLRFLSQKSDKINEILNT